MLSASTLTQMPPSGEDSSGSDRGSEVSVPAPATETDRYGFILGNGSTVGSEGPPPELVRQRETKWINIISQWDRVLLKKSSKVKEQCQKGIPASLRAKCWPLLCGATKRMHRNKDLYETLDSRPALQSCVDVIERDLDRQFPFHEMFLSRDGHGQRGLFRVLKAFTQLKPEEGYCQAQGPVAAVLLMNMPPEEAFWCLVQISEQYLPGYYSPLLEGVLFDAAMLTWVLKKMCPATHKHLQRHGVEPLMFATDWLMCLFTRHLPFNTLLRVWDLFFCYGVRVLFQVAVVLVRRALGRVEQREECEGQMETLERLRGVREQVQQEDDTFIAEVCSVPLSGKDLERQTEKELEKWMKERPASTFDPRGRCHGYRMAWARAREREEERNRKEREKENMSLPLIRLPFLLSLSPSLLRKRWERGSKTDTGEWEGGGREGRKVSEEVWEERSEGGNLRRGSEMDGSPVRAQGVPLSATEDREPVEPREPFEHKEPSEQDRTQKTQLTPDSARVASQQCELTSDPIVTSQGQAEEQGGLSQSQETNHSKDTMETQEVLNKQSTESARIITEHIVTETKDSKAGSGNLVSTNSDDSSQRTPLCDGSSATPSGDFRLCKSGISQKLTRRLSEDLFTDPNQSQPTITHSNQSNTGLIQYDQPQPNTTAPIQVPKHPESPRQVTGSIPGTVPPQTGPKPGRGPTDTPRRFGLFRRLKGEQPKQDRENEPKVPVPKILIQDFSDGTGEGRTVRGEEEEELSSRERRRRRREQERREKEEEKLRKKRQKEMEKEEKERKRERRKPQTRGKSFQVQHNNVPLPGNSGSQTFGSKRNSTPSMETYF
ncbi:hypothetical protein J4Q44_G00315260 [Coregonus suidteri]|uniref:Rab-GAP TBC domain-containing protein n=1 Tax=Coregonus suidteri TaxID=861788 RepID=A0AAN8L1C8_9TELE